jgi:RimJ/RimL family protein N-acetyltransferase
VEKFSERHLHHPGYLEWLSDRENLISLNLTDYLLKPVTIEKLADYYASFQVDVGKMLFAISLLEGERFVGSATLREIGYRGLFDLGILIGEKSVRGQGIAREAIGQLADYAFRELAARKICSSFAHDNFAVLMAFLKNGFRIEGLQRRQQLSVDGKVSDRYIVGLLSGEAGA